MHILTSDLAIDREVIQKKNETFKTLCTLSKQKAII